MQTTHFRLERRDQSPSLQWAIFYRQRSHFQNLQDTLFVNTM
ncbi:hypothetical protein [Nostoc sp.]